MKKQRKGKKFEDERRKNLEEKKATKRREATKRGRRKMAHSLFAIVLIWMGSYILYPFLRWMDYGLTHRRIRDKCRDQTTQHPNFNSVLTACFLLDLVSFWMEFFLGPQLSANYKIVLRRSENHLKRRRKEKVTDRNEASSLDSDRIQTEGASETWVRLCTSVFSFVFLRWLQQWAIMMIAGSPSVLESHSRVTVVLTCALSSETASCFESDTLISNPFRRAALIRRSNWKGEGEGWRLRRIQRNRNKAQDKQQTKQGQQETQIKATADKFQRNGKKKIRDNQEMRETESSIPALKTEPLWITKLLSRLVPLIPCQNVLQHLFFFFFFFFSSSSSSSSSSSKETETSRPEQRKSREVFEQCVSDGEIGKQHEFFHKCIWGQNVMLTWERERHARTEIRWRRRKEAERGRYRREESSGRREKGEVQRQEQNNKQTNEHANQGANRIRDRGKKGRKGLEQEGEESQVNMR